MPITDIFVLSVIVFAFIAFAVVLAWGDYQTRKIARASRARTLTGAGVASLKQSAQAASVGQKAAEKGKAPAHA